MGSLSTESFEQFLDSLKNAGISISSYICDDAQLAEIDAKMDDGDLTTGNFVQVSSSRVRLILARP